MIYFKKSLTTKSISLTFRILGKKDKQILYIMQMYTKVKDVQSVRPRKMCESFTEGGK